MELSRTKFLLPINIENVTYNHVESLLEQIDQLATLQNDDRKGYFYEKFCNSLDLFGYAHISITEIIKGFFSLLMYVRGCLEQIVSLRAHVIHLLQEKEKLEQDNQKLRKELIDLIDKQEMFDLLA